jgi:hypothetical protein
VTENSFILYSEVDLEDNPVDCIYLVKDECRAQPFVGPDKEYYKPTSEDQKDFCKNRENVKACPRLQSYRRHLAMFSLRRGEAASLD